MLIKKTLGFKVSFIVFGALLSACNAYLSGQSNNEKTDAYSGLVSSAPHDQSVSSAEFVKNSNLSSFK